MSLAAKKSRTEPEHGTNRIFRQPDEMVSHIGEFFTPKDVNAWRRTSTQSRYFQRTQETLALPHTNTERQNWQLLEHYNLSVVEQVEARSAWMSPRLLSAICQRCTNLTHLNLHRTRCEAYTNSERSVYHWITDACLEIIAQHCPRLASLNIDGSENNVRLTDAGVIALAKGCPELSSLNLSCCDQVTKDSMIALAQGCKKLSRVNVRLCRSIKDAGIIALAQNCPQLSYLDCSGNELVSDASVLALAQGCPKLSHLNLDHCRCVTSTSVLALAQKCPELCYLNFRLLRVTDEILIPLANGCPLLSYLFLSNPVTLKGVRAARPYFEHNLHQPMKLTLSRRGHSLRHIFIRHGGSGGSGGSSKSSRGSSGSVTGGAASQLTSRSAPARRMRLSYRARF